MFPGSSDTRPPALPPLPEADPGSPFQGLDYPSLPDDSGMTDPDVIPSNPVGQSSIVNTVNPVNDSVQAGLPEDESDSTTETTKPCSFRLPLSVVQSMTHSVMRQKAKNPDYTFHRYGVDVLSNHEQYRQTAADADRYKAQYGNSVARIAETSELLSAEKSKNQELQAQLQQARALATRQPDPAPPVFSAPPAPAVPPTPTPALEDQYIRLKGEIESLTKQNETYRETLNSYQPFLNNIGPVLDDLYAQASIQSWYGPDYYRQIFERGIKPFLPPQQS